MLHYGRRWRTPNEQPHIAPRFVFVQSVKRMAGDDTSLAARAAVEIDLESVLLTCARRSRRQDRMVPSRIEAR
jgi:hypothetical protein